MKLFLISIFFITIFHNSNAQTYPLPNSYEDCLIIANRWCDCYFNQCYSGRKFKKIWNISDIYQMNDSYGKYTFIQGKIQYSNVLDIQQTFLFKMKVYVDEIVFFKQSLSIISGNLEWERCSRKRGYCN